MYDWDDLRDKYMKAAYMNITPDSSFQKYGKNDIIDEEQSVRWNREEAERRNDAYNKELKRLTQEKQQAVDTVMNEIYKNIIEYVEFSGDDAERKARMIWSKVYEDHHSGGSYEIFSYIEDECSFAYGLLH